MKTSLDNDDESLYADYRRKYLGVMRDLRQVMENARRLLGR